MFKQFGETQTTCASLDIVLLRRNTRLASIKLIERIGPSADESKDTVAVKFIKMNYYCLVSLIQLEEIH